MKKQVFFWLAILSMSVVNMTLVSCSDDDSVKPDTNNQQEQQQEQQQDKQIHVSPNYAPIDWEKTEVYESNPEEGKFSFESTEETRKIEPGSVLAIDEGTTGHIVIVTGVEKNGDRVSVTTEEGGLCDIFHDCEITLSSSGATVLTRYAGGGSVYTPSQVFVDGEEPGGLLTRASASGAPITRNIWKWGENYDNTTLYQTSNARVYLEEANFSANFDIVIDMSFGDRSPVAAVDKAYRHYRSKALWMNAMVNGSLESNYVAKAVAEGSARIGSEKDDLWKENIFRPITMKFMVGNIPVFVQLRADLFRGASLEFEGDVSCYYGARSSVEGDLGFKWHQSGGMSPVREMRMNTELIYPTVEGKGKIEGKALLYPRMYIVLYGIIGPSFDIKPYLGCSLTGGFREQLLSSSNDYCAWQLRAYTGVDVAAGLDLKLLGLVDKHEDIGTLNVAEKDLYRSPTRIEFYTSDHDKVRGGVKNKVSFKVYDMNVLAGKEVTTPLPQLVKFEAPGTLSSKYGIAKNGIVSVEWTPASNQDKLTAVLYNADGGVISKEEWGEAAKGLCPDENHPHAIDLGLPSGTKWACCNIGATTPEEYGGYYAWGETAEKKVYSWDTYLLRDGLYSTIGPNIEGTQFDVAFVRWGGFWRMPSYDQISELVAWCRQNHQWKQQDGVTGMLMTGPNGGLLFLPAAGRKDDNGLVSTSTRCYYRSSSRSGYLPYYIDFGPDLYRWWCGIGGSEGFSVRAVCP